MLMATVAWNRRMRNGSFARSNPRVARALRVLAAIYFAVMAVRLGMNIFDNGAEFWRHGAIPVAFHWVLALFLLVSGRAPACESQQREEAYSVPHGDVPALAQPIADGFGFGKQVRYGDSG
jgi:hypothetical protein